MQVVYTHELLGALLTSCLDLMPPSAEDWYTNDYPEEEESDRDDDAGSGECIMSLSAG